MKLVFLFVCCLPSVVMCGQRVSCFHCKFLHFPYECRYTKQCEKGESCYIERLTTSQNVTGWVQGCTTQCIAPFEASLDQLLVGRSTSNMTSSVTPKPFDVTAISSCRRCCSTDFCNMEGCGAPELTANRSRLHCFSCKDHFDATGCESVSLCQSEEICSYEQTKTIFHQHQAYSLSTTGCRLKQNCDANSRPQGGTECSVACCDRSFCNRNCTSTVNTQTEIERYCSNLPGYVYFKSTDSCFKVGSSKSTYIDAKLACAQDMAELIVLETQRKYEIIKSLLKDMDIWIGGEKSADLLFFQWIDGAAVDVHSVNWMREQPLRQPDGVFLGSHQCVYMDFKDMYLWHDAFCQRKMGYICQMKASTETETLMLCRNHISEGFLYYRDLQMCISIEKMTHLSWFDAQTTCQAFPNATLIKIDNTKVTDKIYARLFFFLMNDTDYWIGAKSDLDDIEDFHWTDGSRFSDMHEFPPLWGHPDADTHFCMVLDHTQSYKWAYRQCEDHYSYVCEVTQESMKRHHTTTTISPTLHSILQTNITTTLTSKPQLVNIVTSTGSTFLSYTTHSKPALTSDSVTTAPTKFNGTSNCTFSIHTTAGASLNTTTISCMQSSPTNIGTTTTTTSTTKTGSLISTAKMSHPTITTFSSTVSHPSPTESSQLTSHILSTMTESLHKTSYSTQTDPQTSPTKSKFSPTVSISSTTVAQSSTTVSPSSTTMPQSSTTMSQLSTTKSQFSPTVLISSTTVAPSLTIMPQSSAAISQLSTTKSQFSPTLPISSTTVPKPLTTVPKTSTTVPKSSTIMQQFSTTMSQLSSTTSHSAGIPVSHTAFGTSTTRTDHVSNLHSAETSSLTSSVVLTTKKPPYTRPPVPITCHECSGPEILCELLHAPTTCASPNNYCMNTIVNNKDGTRSVKRQCTNFDTCYREWWVGSSDNDKCRTFDQDFYITLSFQCSFCCITDNCNDRLRPPANTLYKDL